MSFGPINDAVYILYSDNFFSLFFLFFNKCSYVKCYFATDEMRSLANTMFLSSYPLLPTLYSSFMTDVALIRFLLFFFPFYD